MDFDVIVSGVDESIVESTDPAELSAALAGLKAEAVAAGLDRTDPPATLVLGCDSVLAFEGEILGKPTDAAEATRRWQAMRGRSGVLHTGHCLLRSGPSAAADGDYERATGVAVTTVHFADVTDAEIAAYVASGEPLHVAGAFTIDGLGGPFVRRIEGDHTNVVGLSMPLLRDLLAELNIAITDLWRSPAPQQIS